MNLALLVIASLAVWRVSRMITIEEGPFSVFAWIRGKVDPNQQSWVGRGLSCMACVSFWIALVAALAFHASITEWLGMAGGALLINRWSQ